MVSPPVQESQSPKFSYFISTIPLFLLYFIYLNHSIKILIFNLVYLNFLLPSAYHYFLSFSITYSWNCNQNVAVNWKLKKWIHSRSLSQSRCGKQKFACLEAYKPIWEGWIRSLILGSPIKIWPSPFPERPFLSIQFLEKGGKMFPFLIPPSFPLGTL